jgi:hypothetical protein
VFVRDVRFLLPAARQGQSSEILPRYAILLRERGDERVMSMQSAADNRLKGVQAEHYLYSTSGVAIVCTIIAQVCR